MIMNKVFEEEISKKLKYYMNDMVVKSGEEGLHDEHLKNVF